MDIHSVPALQKLEYSIEGDYSAIGKKTTIGEIIGMSQELPPVNTPKVTKGKKLSRKKSSAPTVEDKFDVVKQTMEECKSSAANIIDVGEEG